MITTASQMVFIDNNQGTFSLRLSGTCKNELQKIWLNPSTAQSTFWTGELGQKQLMGRVHHLDAPRRRHKQLRWWMNQKALSPLWRETPGWLPVLVGIMYIRLDRTQGKQIFTTYSCLPGAPDSLCIVIQ